MAISLTSHDTTLNWYALAVCILKSRPRHCDSPEMAFALLEKRKADVDTETLVELKKTMTYKEIGKIYGLTPDAVYNRIRYYRGYRVPGKRGATINA